MPACTFEQAMMREDLGEAGPWRAVGAYISEVEPLPGRLLHAAFTRLNEAVLKDLFAQEYRELGSWWYGYCPPLLLLYLATVLWRLVHAEPLCQLAQRTPNLLYAGLLLKLSHFLKKQNCQR